MPILRARYISVRLPDKGDVAVLHRKALTDVDGLFRCFRPRCDDDDLQIGLGQAPVNGLHQRVGSLLRGNDDGYQRNGGRQRVLRFLMREIDEAQFRERASPSNAA
jgi:hypothetical protein